MQYYCKASFLYVQQHLTGNSGGIPVTAEVVSKEIGTVLIVKTAEASNINSSNGHKMGYVVSVYLFHQFHQFKSVVAVVSCPLE